MAEKGTKKSKGKIPSPTIILNETYQVSLDPHCLILQKAIVAGENDEGLTAEEKKSNFKNMGYYTTWEGIGSSLMKDIQRDKVFKADKDFKITMQQFLDIVNDAHKEVSKIFEDIDNKTKIKKDSIKNK